MILWTKFNQLQHTCLTWRVLEITNRPSKMEILFPENWIRNLILTMTLLHEETDVILLVIMLLFKSRSGLNTLVFRPRAGWMAIYFSLNSFQECTPSPCSSTYSVIMFLPLKTNKAIFKPLIEHVWLAHWLNQQLT